MSTVTSTVTKTVDRNQARVRLLAAAISDVERLEAAKAGGWDVVKQLDTARAYVAAFSAVVAL